jgi:hypothetical protein
LCLGLSSSLFPSGFPTKILYAFLISPIHAVCPTEHISLVLIILFFFLWTVKIMKLLIMQFSPVSSHVIPRRFKHSPLHPVLKHPKFIFFT